jgi:hypothetical protein
MLARAPRCRSPIAMRHAHHRSGHFRITSIGRGRHFKRNRHHQRRRRHLQRRGAAHRQLEHQRTVGSSLRRQRIHSGGSAADRHYGCTRCTGQSRGRRFRAPSTTCERHNNTNNNQSAVAAGDDPYEGPIDHVDHSRVASLGAVLSPNEHYGSTSITPIAMCMRRPTSATTTALGHFAGHGLDSTAAAGRNVCPAYFPRDRRRSSRTGLPATSWMRRRSTGRWL